MDGQLKFFCVFRKGLVMSPCFNPFLNFCFYSLRVLNIPFFLKTHMDMCHDDLFIFCCFFNFFKPNSPTGTLEVLDLVKSRILKICHSFYKAHNLSGERCGLCLPFLCVVWTFHKCPPSS